MDKLPNSLHCAGFPGTLDILDSSDAEVARIDFHSVNMRSKKKRDDIPRPMSWEGELSDAEKDGMCIDEENSAQVNLSYDIF